MNWYSKKLKNYKYIDEGLTNLANSLSSAANIHKMRNILSSYNSWAMLLEEEETEGFDKEKIDRFRTKFLIAKENLKQYLKEQHILQNRDSNL